MEADLLQEPEGAAECPGIDLEQVRPVTVYVRNAEKRFLMPEEFRAISRLARSAAQK
jgi:hypothetical protein